MPASSPPSTRFDGLRRLLDLRAGADVNGAVAGVREDVPVRGATVWMLVCSALLASLGLDTSSTAVVIGAMLISPLMTPILGVGLGVATYDRTLLARSVRSLALATGASLAASTLYFALTPLGDPTPELLSRTRPTLLDVAIAFVGGVAGMVAASRREATNALPGVAIATALMPPLCTAGFGLATGRWTFFAGAFYLFFLNAVCIAAATHLVARLLGVRAVAFLSPERRTRVERAVWAVVLATAVPAGVVLYDTVQDVRVQRLADRFVRTAVQGEGREVLRWSVTGQQTLLGEGRVGDAATGVLKVFLGGRGLRPGEADSLGRLLPGAGLGSYRLRLVPLGAVEGALTAADLAALSAPSSVVPEAAVGTAQALRPDTLALDALSLDALRAEARRAVPSLDTLGLADGVRFGARPDSLATVLVRFDTAASAQDRRLLRAYLRGRLGADSVRLAEF